MIIVINSIANERFDDSIFHTHERRKWQFWAFLELFSIVAIIIAAFLYNLCRFLTPGKIYLYYLLIALRPQTTVKRQAQLWKDNKLQFPDELKNDKAAMLKKKKSETTDYMFA